MEHNKQHVHPLYLGESTIVLGVVLIALNTFVKKILHELPLDDSLGVQPFLQDTILSNAVLSFIVLTFVPFVLIEAILVLYYRCLYYTLGEREISLYSGILVKKRRHLAYERVQSINEQATLIMRLLGLVNLEVECAGGTANDSFVIPCIAKGKGAAIKRDIFARRRALEEEQLAKKAPVNPLEQQASQSGTLPLDANQNSIDKAFGGLSDIDGIFSQTTQEEEQVDYQVSITNKELVLAALSNQRTLVSVFVGVLLVISQIVGVFTAIVQGNAEIKDLVREAFLGSLITNTLTASIAVLVISSLAALVVALINGVLSQAGFKLVRKANRVEISHGLITRYYSGISIDRIQELQIKQGVLHRILGYAEIKAGRIDAQQNGKGQEKQVKGELVLHPFYPMCKVESLIEHLMPEYLEAPQVPNIFPAKVAQRRSLVRNFWLRTPALFLFVLAVLGELVFLYPPLGIAQSQIWWLEILCSSMLGLGLIFAIGSLISAQQWFKHSGVAVNERFLLFKLGGINLTRYIIPRAKIQSGEILANPLQRNANIMTFAVKTAAGEGALGTRHWIYDLPAPEARKLLEWLKPRGVLK